MTNLSRRFNANSRYRKAIDDGLCGRCKDKMATHGVYCIDCKIKIKEIASKCKRNKQTWKRQIIS